MRKARSPDLTDELIEAIVDILDGWSGKLTWELLRTRVRDALGSKYDYSRFTLCEHTRIKKAFDLRKMAVAERTGDGPRIPRDERLRGAFEQIERLKAKVARLSKENDSLLEQFLVWAINAQRNSVPMDVLSKPLEKPHREQSKVKEMRRV